MMAELEKGHTSGVIIHKIDRSARNLKDWAQLGELIDRGIEVHFAHESLDLASRGGRLSADIQAVVAADYIRNLRQEVKKGFYGRLKQGFYPLPAPRGYLDQGKARAKLIDPVAGPLIREAFELYATGSYSISTLREEMYERGLRGKHGKPLAQAALASILHNPFYVGQIRIARTDENFQGVHQPLVRQVIFDRVQLVMSGRAFARPQKHDPVFRRLIKCGTCGYSLVGERQKGHVYYRCHSQTCHRTSVNEVQIQKAIDTFFGLLILSNEEFGDLRDMVDDIEAGYRAKIRKRRADAKSLAAQCEGRLTRLTDAYLDEGIDKATFEQRKAALLAERRKLLDSLEEVEEESDAKQFLKKLELGKTPILQDDFDFVTEIREKVKSTISNLVMRGKELEITPCFPFGHLANWRFNQNGGPSCPAPRTDCALCGRCISLSTPSGRSVHINVAGLDGVAPAQSLSELLVTLETTLVESV